jgi:hypothetical protein
MRSKPTVVLLEGLSWAESANHADACRWRRLMARVGKVLMTPGPTSAMVSSGRKIAGA